VLGQAADGTDITGLGFREITVELHILDESITQRTLGGSGTMRRRTLIIAAWPLIALLGIAVAVKFAPQPAPLRVTVSFLGYTNDMTGAPLAKFAVTNQSTVRIMRWGSFHTENQQQPGPGPLISIGPDIFLMPEQSDVVIVPAATNRGAWRAVFHLSRDDWQRKFSFWTSGLSLIPSRFRRVPVQYGQSEWIDQ